MCLYDLHSLQWKHIIVWKNDDTLSMWLTISPRGQFINNEIHLIIPIMLVVAVLFFTLSCFHICLVLEHETQKKTMCETRNCNALLFKWMCLHYWQFQIWCICHVIGQLTWNIRPQGSPSFYWTVSFMVIFWKCCKDVNVSFRTFFGQGL